MKMARLLRSAWLDPASLFSVFFTQILQQLDRVVVTSLRLVDRGHAVGNVHGVGNQGVGFLQVFERQIVLALAAIDLGDAHVGLRVFGIRVGDDFVLFERGVELAVVEQVFGEAANGVEIVAVENDGVLVGVDGALVILALLVGRAEGGVELGGARGVGNGAQNFQSVRRVAFVGVEHGQRGDGFFGAGIELDRGLEFGFGLLQIVVQAIEAAEQKVIVDAVGIELDDLFVLIDGEFQNVVRTRCRRACRRENADRCGREACELRGSWDRA